MKKEMPIYLKTSNLYIKLNTVVSNYPNNDMSTISRGKQRNALHKQHLKEIKYKLVQLCQTWRYRNSS